jgi:CHASE3 domain sensor protein
LAILPHNTTSGFCVGWDAVVAGSLIALLVAQPGKIDTLAQLREQNVNVSQFVEDINDLEVTIQDMRLASRGYITQNVLFHQQYTDASAAPAKNCY